MQISKKNLSDTKLQLTLTADDKQMDKYKQEVLRSLSKNTSVAGFRQGKAPLNLVEKHTDRQKLQMEFLDLTLNQMYANAVEQEKLRPVSSPEVKIKKFVPFSQLEAEYEVEVVGEVKLPNYKTIKLVKPKVSVTDKEVEEVLNQLKQREAEKKDVERAAKDGDQVWIDFTGVDAESGEPIKGADGKDYPLLLGSNAFIPGFETNLVGQKPGEEKQFTITFPKDYSVRSLQNRKVTFAVTLKKVQEIAEPTVDDKFASKVGPFKSVAELKDDIKKELKYRKQTEADQRYVDDLVSKIAEKSEVAVPDQLVNEQLDQLMRDQRQNLMYRGQTWENFLEAEGLSEEKYREKLRPKALQRVKAGLVLSEIAEAEGIKVTNEELDAQLEALRQNYPDPKMREELNKPEARRNIASRIITEKTISALTDYATA